mmetsp:Transcript_66157/g.133276  ORF Transcript_66157/g.133276 Transcript_66157/m.133276 type:complete len:223 (+) Transcript_66157:189-857(+)
MYSARNAPSSSPQTVRSAASKSSKLWSTCASVMHSGGAKRMMFPCVGLARSPLRMSSVHTFEAMVPSSESSTTTALSRPLPRTDFIAGTDVWMSASPERKRAPITSALPAKSSSTNTLRAATATRHASGLPPYVDPCSPGLTLRTTSSELRTADTGSTPPERAFPSTSTSGFTGSWSQHSILPVRHKPVCTSSAINSTPCFLHKACALERYPVSGTTTPASP